MSGNLIKYILVCLRNLGLLVCLYKLAMLRNVCVYTDKRTSIFRYISLSHSNFHAIKKYNGKRSCIEFFFMYHSRNWDVECNHMVINRNHNFYYKCHVEFTDVFQLYLVILVWHLQIIYNLSMVQIFLTHSPTHIYVVDGNYTVISSTSNNQ